jgi:hypothetical protein
MQRKTAFALTECPFTVARAVGVRKFPRAYLPRRRGAEAPVLPAVVRRVGVSPGQGGWPVPASHGRLPAAGPGHPVHGGDQPPAADGGLTPGAFGGVPGGGLGVPVGPPGGLHAAARRPAGRPLVAGGLRADRAALSCGNSRPGRPDRAGGVDGAGPAADGAGIGREGRHHAHPGGLPPLPPEACGPDAREPGQDRTPPGLVHRPHARRDAGLPRRRPGQTPASSAAARVHGPDRPQRPAVGPAGSCCHVPGRDSLLGAAGPGSGAGTDREPDPTDGGEGSFPPRAWGESSPCPGRQPDGGGPAGSVRQRNVAARSMRVNDLRRGSL